MRRVTHRILAVAALSMLTLGLAVGPARADDEAAEQIAAKTSEAMSSYDMMEFEAAKKLLTEAVAMARDSGVDGEVAARAYLDLGIVQFSGFGDESSAREAFAAAVAIDPTIEIGVGYRTGELETLLDEARREASATGGGGGSGGGGCKIDGIEHELIDMAPAGEARRVRVTVGKSVKARRVKLFYRSEGETKFRGVDLDEQDGCEYVGEIPAEAVRGEFMHYYVAAVNRKGKALANKGSSGSPNIIEIGAIDSGENPLGGDITRKSDEDDDGAGDSGDSRIFLSVAVGSGAGYVSGKTELARNDVACCFAPALLHLMPEVGYFLSKQSSVSLAFRMGFPVGANLEGHATFAPSALLRYRYALDPSGNGLMVSGAVGGGILRHTVKLDDATGDMDTDTTAAGPILIGGGFGYSKPLGGSMQLIAELNAIAGLTAGITEIGSGPGSTRPNNGLQFDFNLGLLIGF